MLVRCFVEFSSRDQMVVVVVVVVVGEINNR